MKHRAVVPALVFVRLIAASTPAHAQSSPQFFREPPPHEVGIDIGVYSFEGFGMVGGHVTRSITDWFAAEASLAGSKRDELLGLPRSALVTINARFRIRNPNPDRGWLFLTAGEGLASGLSYSHSPMLGVGAQSDWAHFLGWRLDFQRFWRGNELHGGIRMSGAFVIAIPR
jgi:hypothetical protein